MVIEYVDLETFVKTYCERQKLKPEELRRTLDVQYSKFGPDGWVLLECQVLNSSRIGDLTIVPYGPHNSWKQVPIGPVSPRGLASDTSFVIQVLLVGKYLETVKVETEQ